MSRRGRASIAASPVLVGAVTLLVAIVAIVVVATARPQEPGADLELRGIQVIAYATSHGGGDLARGISYVVRPSRRTRAAAASTGGSGRPATSGRSSSVPRTAA